MTEIMKSRINSVSAYESCCNNNKIFIHDLLVFDFLFLKYFRIDQTERDNKFNRNSEFSECLQSNVCSWQEYWLKDI